MTKGFTRKFGKGHQFSDIRGNSDSAGPQEGIVAPPSTARTVEAQKTWVDKDGNLVNLRELKTRKDLEKVVSVVIPSTD